MRRRTLLAAAVATASSFAGCLGDERPSGDDGDGTDGSADAADGDTADGASDEPPTPTDDQVFGQAPVPDDFPEDVELDRESPSVRDAPFPYPEVLANLETVDPAGTAATVTIGDPDAVDYYESVELQVWNATDVERTVTLGVVDDLREETVHDNRHELPADEELFVTVAEPSEYRLDVGVAGTDLDVPVALPCAVFDCNWTEVALGVVGDDEVRARTRSELLGCASLCGAV